MKNTEFLFSKRKPLKSFFGVLSEKSGKHLEFAVEELRKKRNEAHRAKLRKSRNPRLP